MGEEQDIQPEVDAFEQATRRDRPVGGDPSAFTCPECGGTLWELHEGELLRFRCRVGHAYSPESLEAAQAESLEAALWAALRALEESAALSRRLMKRARQQGKDLAADRFAVRVEDAEHRAAIVRQALRLDHAGAALQASAGIEDLPTLLPEEPEENEGHRDPLK